jgi:hypothetical protein
MFKKTVTYQNFNDETVSKDFYFHMSKAELLEMAADGNVMMERIKRIIAANDGKAILKEFRELIWASVGIRSEDGNRFVKDNDAKRELFESPAFDELLMELATSADAGADFVRQLIPEKMQKEMQKQLEKQQGTETAPNPFADKEDKRPAWEREHRHPTDAEVREMSKEELVRAIQFRQGNPN